MKTNSRTDKKGNNIGGMKKVTRTNKLGCSFRINFVVGSNSLIKSKIIGHYEHSRILLINFTFSEKEDREIK